MSVKVSFDSATVQAFAEIVAVAVRKQIAQPQPGSPTTKASGTNSSQLPLLWSVKDVAKALQMSERTIWGLRQSGRMPPPLSLMTQPRWSVDVIRAWIAEGCPATRSEQAQSLQSPLAGSVSQKNLDLDDECWAAYERGEIDEAVARKLSEEPDVKQRRRLLAEMRRLASGRFAKALGKEERQPRAQ